MSYSSSLKVRDLFSDLVFCVFLSVTFLIPLHVQALSSVPSDPFNVISFDCSRIQELGIEKQGNLRAGAILRYCRTGRSDIPGQLEQPKTIVEIAYPPSGLPLFGGTDINLITGTETSPHITQAESSAWGHGNTIVVAMDDSRGIASSPVSACSVSVSTDGGATFTRLAYAFNTTNACYGDPSVFYSVRAGKWFIGFFALRCGVSAMGQWESTDGINWTESGCITPVTIQADWLTSWVDNNPSSPFYGRQYALFNDFSSINGNIRSTFSTDDGVNWSTPTVITPTFRRPVKIFGSLGSDGTVFVQALDEGAGGLVGPRTNYIYRSTDGAVSWGPAIPQGASFPAPGRSFSGFFAGMYTTPVAGYWRYQGYGQPGVGPSGVVHYVFTSSTDGGADPGNIYYIRSTDNGSIWSVPLRLNTDATARAQFQPSLAVNANGKVVATWFDERNTVGDNLQRFARISLNGGASWGPDQSISDVTFPKPLQPDPSLQSRYAGDRHEAMFSNNGYGNVAYDTWTDGRVSIEGNPQQDVFFDKFILGSAPFDFDGDGKTDIGIFRPAGGEWWVNRSSTGQTFALQFGALTDRITPADYTGDGKADIAFFRPSSGEWYVLRSEDFSFFALPFGTNGDVPVPADYDADGKADFAVFRPSISTWFISQSSGAPTRIVQFGVTGDQPVVADYDGDGRADIGIFRPGPAEWWIQRSTAGLLSMQFGASTDKAVQGDYTGDGKADVAIWRPSTGQWFIVRSEDSSFYGFPFGANGDVPSPGDYDGDGKFDATVFRPSSATWFIARSTAGTQIVQFGATGDRPIPNAFVP